MKRFKIPFKGAPGEGLEGTGHSLSCTMCFQCGARLSGSRPSSISYCDLTQVTWPPCASVSSSAEWGRHQWPCHRLGRTAAETGRVPRAQALCAGPRATPRVAWRPTPALPPALPLPLSVGCPSFCEVSKP